MNKNSKYLAYDEYTIADIATFPDSETRLARYRS